SRRPRRALPLALLLAEHALDRRGARARVRGMRVPGALAGLPLAPTGRADLDRRGSPPGAARRPALRAFDVLPPVLPRDLPALSRAVVAHGRQVPSRSAQRDRGHGRRAARPATARWVDARAGRR